MTFEIPEADIDEFEQAANKSGGFYKPVGWFEDDDGGRGIEYCADAQATAYLYLCGFRRMGDFDFFPIGYGVNFCL